MLLLAPDWRMLASEPQPEPLVEVRILVECSTTEPYPKHPEDLPNASREGKANWSFTEPSLGLEHIKLKMNTNLSFRRGG